MSLTEAIESRVQRIPISGCWIWTGSLSRSGYALLTTDRQRQAHRVAYEHFRGPIAAGMVLDHVCRVRCCVNPAHLGPVTCKENVRRGDLPHMMRQKQIAKTHCRRGHPRTDANTYRHADGRKYCRVCTLENQRRKYRESN